MHTAFSLYLKKKCKNFNQSFVKNKLDEKYKSFFYLKKNETFVQNKKRFLKSLKHPIREYWKNSIDWSNDFMFKEDKK